MFSFIFKRIRAILFAAIFAAMGHSLLVVLLPIALREDSVSINLIGMAMSSFAVGQILSSLYGNKIIIYIGHIRIYAAMATIIAMTAIVHSYFNHIAVVFVGRIIVGACIGMMFITLESWLNSTSDKNNRATVFSIFQVLYGLGYAAAPFWLSLGDTYNVPFFALAAFLLSLSLLPLTMSHQVTPQLPTQAERMSVRRLYQLVPAGAVTSFASGIIVGPILTLNVIYAQDLLMVGFLLSVLLASPQIGGFLSQLPMGILADRIDKRTLVALLMAVCLLCNGLIVLHNFQPINIYVLLLLMLVSYGFSMCLYPLACTQVFDLIESHDAVPATSTLLLIFSVGFFIGPIAASQLMDFFGSYSLHIFLIVCNAVLFLFIVMRRLVKPRTLDNPVKYQTFTSPDSAVSTNFDPRTEYKMADINSASMAILIEALAQNPSHPEKLIATAFDHVKYEPSQVASSLVYHLPRQSEMIMRAFVMLYPESRLEIAQGLRDIFLRDKTRINALVTKGLMFNASSEEQAQIKETLKEIEEIVHEEQVLADNDAALKAQEK